MKSALLVALGVLTATYLVVWVRSVQRAGGRGPAGEGPRPGARHLLIGFVTNFLDTLGIGSFATTTSMFRFGKVVEDRLIPGTLNVGHTAPTVVQAFIYISIVTADMTTLVAMIAASVFGAWLGAGIVAGWSRRKVQIGMGSALLVAAVLFTYKNLPSITGQPNLLSGGDIGTTHLEGMRLVIGVVGNFALGALMTLGIGMYAPCMILVGLLGMSPAAAFPIMMGSCAFLMPIATSRFVEKRAYALKPSLGLAIGGIPAVLVAAFLVVNMDVTIMRWLVVVVVTIAATMMLRSAAKGE